MQTKLSSMMEAVLNVLIGYSINMTANFLIFPLFGWQISLQENLLLGVFYTAISLARSYAVRRWFNGRLVRSEIFRT